VGWILPLKILKLAVIILCVGFMRFFTGEIVDMNS
jgi:hypothetical protein